MFDATLWSEEPETFAAFVALLHRRRFLGVAPDEQLPALLEASAAAQEEVTTALGGQVRNPGPTSGGRGGSRSIPSSRGGGRRFQQPVR